MAGQPLHDRRTVRPAVGSGEVEQVVVHQLVGRPVADRPDRRPLGAGGLAGRGHRGRLHVEGDDRLGPHLIELRRIEDQVVGGVQRSRLLEARRAARPGSSHPTGRRSPSRRRPGRRSPGSRRCPPAMPIITTRSNGPPLSSCSVARCASTGPMPVLRATTSAPPRRPVRTSIAPRCALRRPRGFTSGRSSDGMAPSTAMREAVATSPIPSGWAPGVLGKRSRTVSAMGRVLLVTWDGGGNVPPAVALGTRLAATGHDVAAYGSPSLAGRFAADGLAFTARDVPDPWDTTAMAVDVAEHCARVEPDLVVVDYMLPGALCARRGESRRHRGARPHAVRRAARRRRPPVADGDGGVARHRRTRRARAIGLAPVDSMGTLLDRAERVVGRPARAELDAPVDDIPGNVRYVGPVFEPAASDAGWTPPPGDDPLVVVSLGTTPMDEAPVLQAILDGLAGAPVRVLAMCGDHLAEDDLRLPAERDPDGLRAPRRGAAPRRPRHRPRRAGHRAGHAGPRAPAACASRSAGTSRPTPAAVSRTGAGVVRVPGTRTRRARRGRARRARRSLDAGARPRSSRSRSVDPVPATARSPSCTRWSPHEARSHDRGGVPAPRLRADARASPTASATSGSTSGRTGTTRTRWPPWWSTAAGWPSSGSVTWRSGGRATRERDAEFSSTASVAELHELVEATLATASCRPPRARGGRGQRRRRTAVPARRRHVGRVGRDPRARGGVPAPRPHGAGGRRTARAISRRPPRSRRSAPGSSRRSRARVRPSPRRRAGRGRTPSPGRCRGDRPRREGGARAPARHRRRPLGRAPRGARCPSGSWIERARWCGGSHTSMCAWTSGLPSSAIIVTVTVFPAPGSPTHDPNQRAVLSDSVMLAQTSSTEPANRRVSTRSRPSAVVISRPVGVGVMRCPPVGRSVRWRAGGPAGPGAPRCRARRGGCDHRSRNGSSQRSSSASGAVSRA